MFHRSQDDTRTHERIEKFESVDVSGQEVGLDFGRTEALQGFKIELRSGVGQHILISCLHQGILDLCPLNVVCGGEGQNMH